MIRGCLLSHLLVVAQLNAEQEEPPTLYATLDMSSCMVYYQTCQGTLNIACTLPTSVSDTLQHVYEKAAAISTAIKLMN